MLHTNQHQFQVQHVLFITLVNAVYAQ